MTLRSVLFFLVSSLGVAAATSAQAATCAFDTATQVATVGAAGGAAVSVSKGRIMVSGIACGTATLTNTRRIAIRGGTSGEKVTIKLGGGAFAPGADLEPSGTAEIEFDVDLGAGTDTLMVSGGAAVDHLVIGAGGIDMDDDDDADVTLAGVEKVTLAGGAGNDHLSGAGDDSTGAAWAAPLTLQGSVGDDDLEGGDGNDKLQGGDGDDEIDGGDGDDVLDGGNDDDALSGDADDDILHGGAGSDLLQGDGGDDDLDGGDGDDVEEGGEGNDDFACGAGTDTTDRDAGDDDQGQDGDDQGQDGDDQGEDCEL